MKTAKSYTIWLETAYILFAEKGPEKFSIKEVAKKCGLPRTNFYYYFDSKDDLLDKVIDLHFQTTVEIFNTALITRLNVFIPDLHKVTFDFKIGIEFTKTLFKHRDIPKYNDAYIKGTTLSVDIIVPKFKEYFGITMSDAEAKKLWFTLTDTWYSRLSFDNYTVEYLCELSNEFMDTILPLIEHPKKHDKS